MKNKINILAVLSLVGIFGCAKSPNYETVYKSPKQTSISESYDTTAEYLYVPMVLNAPKDIPDADPFFQGTPKIVRIAMTEKGIQVTQEADIEDRNNSTNNRPVMLIPGSYHSYKCSENSLGECTNREEENNKLEWNQKAFFTPDLEETQIQEVNSIQVFNIEGSKCVKEIGVKLVDYTIEKGIINFELEKTFQTINTPSCVNPLLNKRGNLDDASFNVRFYYSLIKLDNLISSDYEKISYTDTDRTTFGFFSVGKQIKNENVHENRLNAEFFMTRYNPKRKVIPYYLSETFNKPENRILLDATIKAFDSINSSLNRANTGLNLKLEMPSGKNPGDIRYSMINLIDEKRESGLLGYGPSVANPRTGEIIRGMVNLYSGVLKSNIRGIWNSMAIFSKKKNIINQPETIGPAEVAPSTTPTPVSSRIGGLINSARNYLDTSDTFEKNPSTLMNVVRDFETKKSNYSLSNEKDDRLVKLDKRLDRFSENNAYAEEFLNVSSTSRKIFPGVEKFSSDFFTSDEKRILKSWDDLTKEQQKYAQDFILPFLYTATLIHELGHNLGLRHNFMGSYDKHNFYNEEEAHEIGLNSVPQYSSIMDYSGNEMEDAQAFGKYDLAALRFGYAREVETTPNTFITVKSNLEDLENEGTYLKPYLYCTDENEGTSVKCNKFDEGTTTFEIASNIINRYEESYDFLNLRDGRIDYGVDFMDSYLYSRYMQFRQLRAVFEEWDKDTRFPPFIKISGCRNLTINNPLYRSSCLDLQDNLAAVNLVGEFFLNVIKTPDHLCAFADVSNPEVTVIQTPLSTIIWKDLGLEKLNSMVTSCFDERIKAIAASQGKVVRGESGKFLNHQIEINKKFRKYQSDRSVFGIWVDKLLAAKFLTQRRSVTYGNGNSNFSVLPKIQEELGDYLSHLVTGDPLRFPVKFKDEKGVEYNDNLSYTLTFPDLNNEDFMTNGLNEIINNSDADNFVKEYFNLPNAGIISMNASILNNMVKWELDGTEHKLPDAVTNASVLTLKKRYYDDIPVNADFYRVLPLEDKIIYADKGNSLAYTLIGRSLMFNILKEAGVEKVKKVFEAVTNPPYLAEMTDDQKQLVSIGLLPLKGLVDIKTKKPNLTAANFAKILKAQGIDSSSLAIILKAFKENTAESLSAIISKMEEYNKVLDSLPEDEKLLSKQNPTDLNAFLKGDMDKQDHKIRNVLDYLPEFPKAN